MNNKTLLYHGLSGTAGVATGYIYYTKVSTKKTKYRKLKTVGMGFLGAWAAGFPVSAVMAMLPEAPQSNT